MATKTKTGSRKSTTQAKKQSGSRNGSRANGQKSEPWASAKGEDKRFLSRYGEKLSPSTQRAKWISEPGEEPDRPGQTLATRSHELIQDWAKKRKASPATVETKQSKADDRPHTLRFDFPGYGGRRLTKIKWDDFFKTFDSRKLVFLFQRTKRDGNQSNFFRFDNPNREDA